MEMNDVLMLAKAGFTAQQIAAMAQIQKAPAPAPAPTPTPAPAPTPAPVTNNPELPNSWDGMADLFKSLAQGTAIQLSEQPKPQTTEDILAEIINPPTAQLKLDNV